MGTPVCRPSSKRSSTTCAAASSARSTSPTSMSMWTRHCRRRKLHPAGLHRDVDAGARGQGRVLDRHLVARVRGHGDLVATITPPALRRSEHGRARVGTEEMDQGWDRRPCGSGSARGDRPVTTRDAGHDAGMRRARPRSTRSSTAWAWVLRTTTAWSMPGTVMSPTKRPAPLRKRGSSRRLRRASIAPTGAAVGLSAWPSGIPRHRSRPPPPGRRPWS